MTLIRSPWVRRALWSLGGLLALWVLAWVLVPPLAKSQIEAKGSEALGRKLTIGAIDFKPWTLELAVSDIAVATADGTGKQLGIARIYVDAELASLLHLAPVLDAITVDAPALQITHLGGGHYDIDDILQHLAEQPASEPLRFALYNVTLNAGTVDFTDRIPAQAGKGGLPASERQHALRKLSLALPFLSNLDSKRDIKVAPRLAFELNGSAFDTAAQGTPFAISRKGDATFKIAHLDLAPYLAYLPTTLPVQVQAAVVDAELQLAFVQSPKVAVTLAGKVKVSGLKVADSAKGELLGVESIQTVLADVRPLEQVVKLASIEVNAPQLRVARNRVGRLNLDAGSSPVSSSAIKKEAARATSAGATGLNGTENPVASKPWTFELAHFALRQGALAWADDSIQPPSRLNLAALELVADGVRWPFADAPATFEGSVAVPVPAKSSGKAAAAVARLSFKGSGTDKLGKVHLSVGDMALGLAAPYVAQYLEPTAVGVLDAELDVAWADGKLQVAAPRVALRDFALQSAKAPALAATATSAERAAAELPQFKLLEITDTQIDVMAKTGRVGKVALRGTRAMLHRDGTGHWMFERWRKTPQQPEAANLANAANATEPKPSAPWKLTLDDLQVDDATLMLDDRSHSKPVRLEASSLKVQMKSLTLDGKKPAPLILSARVKSGRTEPGTLGFKGTVMWGPVVAQGTLEAADIPAHALAPYVADQLNIELLRADTSFKGQLRYAATPAGAEVQVRGDAALEDFLANSASEELLSWKSLNVPGIVLAMAPGAATRLDVREAALTDFFARVTINPSGRINLQDLVKSDKPAAGAPSGAPASIPETAVAPVAGVPAALEPIVKFGPISLVNGKVLFSDHFIQPNYSADLSELTGKLSQFSSQAQDGVVQLADLNLTGRAEGTASLEITGRVNPLAKPLALDIKGRVRDLELPPLSPYAIKYAGYGITRGKLSVDVNYAVQPDGQLTANNNIVLNQLAFGDKVDGAPNSLPVKLAVALLADRNGVIDINLPISGSLNDPQFKLGAVVWKVITNLIVKAITSPFSLLAGAFGGGGGEELSSVVFAPGSSALSAQAIQGLDKVAKALTDRPALAMTVVGTSSLEVEREAVKSERLKTMLLAEKRRRAVVSGGNAAAVQALDASESAALLRAVYRRADITKPRNLVGLAKDIPEAEMEALLKANMSVNEDAMRELALQRGVVVKDYLASRQLPAERLFLGAAKAVKPDASADAVWKPSAELSLTQR
jgi:hypothetical protein